MKKVLRGSSFLVAALSMATLFGCANYEVNTKRGNIPGKYIRYEMQESDRAVEAARLAGKDKICPAEFKAAEDAKNNAYDVFRACRTEEGAALAKKATEKANAPCPVRVVEKAPAPVPVPVPVIVPPADSDRDGVIDTLDKCPNTPAGVAVDSKGCPLDSDKDGVADYLDKCPGTPAGTAVDRNGCGLVAAKKYCEKPAVIAITFDTNKAAIKPEFHDELATLGAFLKEFPNAKGVIAGYTDADGTKAANLKLSQSRASSVRNYIVSTFGIDANRIDAKGYGEEKPVASNKTAAGKATNRRIEAIFSCN